MSARIEAARFPQLTDQVRTSTGFTHARGGVIRQAPPIARERTQAPVIRDLSISPTSKKRAKRRHARGDL